MSPEISGALLDGKVMPLGSLSLNLNWPLLRESWFSHDNIRDVSFYIRCSFLIGVELFLLLVLCFTKSKYSWWDAIAAKRVLRYLRIFICLEWILLAILLFFIINYGNPIVVDTVTDYAVQDSHNSYNFGYARPIVGMIGIGLGYFGHYNCLFRSACIITCTVQIAFDLISTFQLSNYVDTIYNISTVSLNIGKYSKALLVYGYWRDIISVGICTAILCLTLYLSIITGCTANKYIHVKDIDDDIDDEKLAYLQNHLPQENSNKKKWSPALKSKPNMTAANKRTWLGGKYRGNQIVPVETNHSELDVVDEGGDARYKAKPGSLDV